MIQNVIALSIVTLTVAFSLYRIFRRKPTAKGCSSGGDCGCKSGLPLHIVKDISKR